VADHTTKARPSLLFVIDWQHADPQELADLAACASGPHGRWSVLNCHGAGPAGGRLSRSLAYLRMAWRLRRLSLEHDHIVVWQPLIGYLLCLLPRWPGRAKLVMTTVLYAPSNAPPHSWRGRLLARAMQRADLLVWFSQGMAAEARQAWPHLADKVYATAMPLVGAKAGPDDTLPQASAVSTGRVGVFAGGSSDRDFDTVIDAFTGTDVPVTLVCRAHQTFAQPERLSANFTVLREVDEAHYHALLRAADAVVVALKSAASGCGQLLYAHAMLYRVPVIATDAHGTRDVVTDGVTGLLVPPRDAQAIRSAWQRLQDDPALRARLVERGREQARAMDFGVWMRRIGELATAQAARSAPQAGCNTDAESGVAAATSAAAVAGAAVRPYTPRNEMR
jgi:glycosyltransferase involved in cell wall biosynthesis